MSAERLFVAVGALSALAAVALGAYGAHALPEDQAVTWGKAVDYQMAHALGLLLVALTAASPACRTGAPAPGTLRPSYDRYGSRRIELVARLRPPCRCATRMTA